MFFELHNENRIGYKELTKADLGLLSTSHQTHIGLFDDVLTFLPNNAEPKDSMMIFDNSVELLTLNFDRIENPNHTFRSPKIRTGGRDVVSIVSFIRDKAKTFPSNLRWFLFWFGLKSEQTVFFLFNDQSTTFSEISSIGINLSNGVKNRLTCADKGFNILLTYLENVVNKSSTDIVQELEVVAQTNEINSFERFREYDITRAREIFSKIGKEGEYLIDKYFSEQKRKGLISNYKWINEDKECGLPYDFYVESLTGEIIYLDVKTTNYKFAQKMVFSSQEIGFATSMANKYCIYRVYYNENGERCLKICSDTKALFSKLQEKTIAFEDSVLELATVETIKMAIMPIQELLTFGQEILLTA